MKQNTSLVMSETNRESFLIMKLLFLLISDGRLIDHESINRLISFN